ncbi:MAG: DNA-processing protein DprA [Phycisphaerae bacterium]|nr:DNA-processing protein DprA [Phycisphaerae bacterium]
MAARDCIRAYLRLALAEGVGPKTFQRMTEAFGGVEQAVAASPGAWKRVEGVGPKKLDALLAVTEDQIDEELTEAGRLGVRIFCLDDDDYPAVLKQTSNPPPLLYIRGRLEPADAVALGVVGSRRCTHYGAEQAERFGGLLGRAGLTVISGGARGVDTAAHTGALRAGGRTVAVMGCGLSTHYPPENEKLFEKIVAEDRGALLSELPMKTAVLAGNFPTRNRIISGLSLGVLVVEAALPSGALITAREAAEQGREIFAVPGKVDSPMSAGTHQLLRDGAHLAADLDDILGPLGDVGRKIHPPEPDAKAIPTGLDDMETLLIQALAEGPRHLDDLVHYTGVETGKAAAAMTMLVLKGAVKQQPGNVFARK